MLKGHKVIRLTTIMSLLIVLLACTVNTGDDSVSIDTNEDISKIDTICTGLLYYNFVKEFRVNDTLINEFPREKNIDLKFRIKKSEFHRGSLEFDCKRMSKSILTQINIDLTSESSNLKITKLDNLHFNLVIKDEYVDAGNIAKFDIFVSPKKKHSII